MGRASTLKALRYLFKTNIDPIRALEDMLQILRERDRSVTIVYSSMIDDALRACLVKRMRHLTRTEIDELFGVSRPLSSFSSRIMIAYAMRAIDREVYEDLQVIRMIRNAAAHATTVTSFKIKEIADACSLFNATRYQPVPGSAFPDDGTPFSGPKLVFFSSCTKCFLTLFRVVHNSGAGGQKGSETQANYSETEKNFELMRKYMASKTE